MKQTVKAVLARFNGDKISAAVYCHDMITRYPHLRDEYTEVLMLIAAETGKELWEAAHA